MNEYLVVRDWWVDTLILAYLIRMLLAKGTPLIPFILLSQLIYCLMMFVSFLVVLADVEGFFEGF